MEVLKRSYSSWNILQSKLSGQTEVPGLLKSLFTNRKYLTVTIPYYDYIRGQVFISDLKFNFKDQVPFRFDLSILIYMLYDDLLSQIKNGIAKNQQIAEYLIAGKKKYFPKKIQQKRIMKPLTKHIFEFETVEEEIEDNQDDKSKTAYLELRMSESEVLRGEILLHDLDSFLSGTDTIITIEELITINYLEFIESIKSTGNSIKVQKTILSHLK